MQATPQSDSRPRLRNLTASVFHLTAEERLVAAALLGLAWFALAAAAWRAHALNPEACAESTPAVAKAAP
jgi:hypothetical protein